MKEKSISHQLFDYVIKTFDLRRCDHAIFKLLHSYFIHKEKPFFISTQKLMFLTGFKKQSIYNSMKKLEMLHLIKRQGQSNTRKFTQGDEYKNIFGLLTNNPAVVQNMECLPINELDKNCEVVQTVDSLVQNADSLVQNVDLSLVPLQKNTTTTPLAPSGGVHFLFINSKPWMVSSLKGVHRYVNLDGQEDYKDEGLYLRGCDWHISERVSKEQRRDEGSIGIFVTDLCKLIRSGFYRFDRFDHEARYRKSKEEADAINKVRDIQQEIYSLDSMKLQAIRSDNQELINNLDAQIARLKQSLSLQDLAS